MQPKLAAAAAATHTFGPAPTAFTDNDGAVTAPITRDGAQLPIQAFDITVTGTDEPTGTSVASQVLRPQV